MIPTVSGAIVFAIGLWCQFGGYRRTVLAMFGLIVLASASAVDLPALGGASITPANFFLLFYVLRLVAMRNGMGLLAAEIEPRRPLFLFFLLILWIVGSALLLPRLFEGQTSVFSLSRSDTDSGTTLLAPTSGNISQAVYAIGGFLTACVTAVFARKPGGYRVLLSALTLVTSLDIFFAVVDLVSGVTHTGFILDPIHTASYAFLTDDELGGLKRISGSFSEASSFATFSLCLLGTNFALFVSNVRPRFTGTASALLLVLIVLATSSAGYAGLGALLAGFLVYAAVAGVAFGKRRATLVALGVVGAGVLAVGLVYLLLPPVAHVAQTVIEESLLSKGETESAVERGSWNAQAWQVFLDTHGLGAGIGTTRGSNYLLVLLSNLGAIGFALFALLMLRTTLARLSPQLDREGRAVVWAARVGALVALVPSILVGTVYDLGTLFYALVGIAASGAAVPEATPARRPAALNALRDDDVDVPSNKKRSGLARRRARHGRANQQNPRGALRA